MTKIINILGYDYTVDTTSETMKSLRGFSGICNFNNQTITIANDINKKAVSSVLIHEIIEAINYHLELKLKHRQISSLECAIFQVLVNNGVNLDSLVE